jgi:transmembrane sensor
LVQAGAVMITVLEGTVDVAAIAARPGNVVRVRAGHSVAITPDGQLGRPAEEQASADRILAWREGKLHFDAWPLAQAVAEHNRYARKPIQLDSSVPADVRVSGVFRIGDTQAFLAALQSLMAVQVVDTGDVLLASVAPPVHQDPLPSGVRQDDP